MASRASVPCCFRRLHSSAPRPPEIISSTIASCPALSSHRLGLVGGEGRHFISLGAQEELPRSAATGSRSASRTSSRVRTPEPSFTGADRLALLREQPVGVGRRKPARDLRRDEAELLHLLAGVKPVSARAPLRDDRRVALLPVADRRGRNFQHSSYCPNAVDAAISPNLISHAGDASRPVRWSG